MIGLDDADLEYIYKNSSNKMIQYSARLAGSNEFMKQIYSDY